MLWHVDHQVQLLSGFDARTYVMVDREFAEEHHQKLEKTVNDSKTVLQTPLCTVFLLTFKKRKKW